MEIEMTKPRLNQIIAVSKGVKSRTEAETTRVYQMLQREDRFDGMSRHYTPSDAEGEEKPSEQKLVQTTVESLLRELTASQTNLMDTVITQDAGNQIAMADIVVNGDIVAGAVPVTTLIFLEKKLTDLTTVMRALPVHSPDYNWEDLGDGTHRSNPITSVSTKKIRRNHEVAPATNQHAAQVEVYTEDVVVGEWSQTKLTGRIPAARRQAMIDRVVVLQDAVKTAREQANSIEIPQQKIGRHIMDYIIGSPEAK